MKNKLFSDSPAADSSFVSLRTPLQPIVACIGSKLSVCYSFVLDDPKFYYVVWYIGHYRVERTNHRFHVSVDHVVYREKILKNNLN